MDDARVFADGAMDRHTEALRARDAPAVVARQPAASTWGCEVKNPLETGMPSRFAR